MTEPNLIEGQRLLEMIKSYGRTLEIFEEMEEKHYKERIAEFLTSMRIVPNKDHMANVMRNAVIDSCRLCIEQAQEKFDKL